VTATDTTYTVPTTSTDFVGFALSEDIYTATVAVVDAGVNESSGMTPTIAATIASTVTTSTNIGAGTGTKGSSTATHNAAVRAVAPSWMLFAAAVAGAVVEV
jgi:hypothetical protein